MSDSMHPCDRLGSGGSTSCVHPPTGGAYRFDYRRIATAQRAGWLEEVVPGVLVLTGSTPTWHQRLMVLVLAGNGRPWSRTRRGCTASTGSITPEVPERVRCPPALQTLG